MWDTWGWYILKMCFRPDLMLVSGYLWVSHPLSVGSHWGPIEPGSSVVRTRSMVAESRPSMTRTSAA